MSDSRTAQQASFQKCVFSPRLLFTENPHSLPSRWSSSTQPSKSGIFGTHFDRNSEHLDSHTPLSDYRREAGLPKMMLCSSFYSRSFRPTNGLCLFDKCALEKIPARKRFRKTRRRGIFQRWLLSNFSGLRGCCCVFNRGLSGTERIEPERCRQNCCHSAVDASAPVMMRLTGWTKQTPVNYVLEADMVNAPALSPGWSSALVLRRALHNRH